MCERDGEASQQRHLPETLLVASRVALSALMDGCSLQDASKIILDHVAL